MKSPSIRLPFWEGSLEDLALAVRRGQISLVELPLASLTEQILVWLKDVGGHRLDEPMESMELACRLIYWKSAALLPPANQAVAEAELREEIDRQLSAIEKARIEHLRDFLAERLLAAGGALEAPSNQAEFEPDLPEEPEPFPSLWTLRKKFQFLRRRSARQKPELALLHSTNEDISVVEMSGWLRGKLNNPSTLQPVPVDTLFDEVGVPRRKVALFLAMLEMARSDSDLSPRIVFVDDPHSPEVATFGRIQSCGIADDSK
jgi:segregation and condensation protein A